MQVLVKETRLTWQTTGALSCPFPVHREGILRIRLAGRSRARREEAGLDAAGQRAGTTDLSPDRKLMPPGATVGKGKAPTG